MDLYIGNATRKQFTFAYWTNAARSPRSQHVPIGGQVKISGDLTQKEVDSILDQHRRYGLIPVDEINNVRNFAGYCFSVGAPIPAEKLARLMGTNQHALIVHGQEIRRNAAIAAAKGMDAELTSKGIPEQLTGLEATIQQEDAPADGSEQFSEGIVVDLTAKDGETPAAAPGRGFAPRGRRTKQ